VNTIDLVDGNQLKEARRVVGSALPPDFSAFEDHLHLPVNTLQHARGLSPVIHH
jgi:hypothetical protein